MPAYFEWHRPREDTVSVSASDDVHSGDYVCDGTNDQVEINAALTYVSGLGGGSVVCLQGAYALAATVNVPANCTLKGVGWGTIFNYDAGGNCITITGDNAKVRDLKVDIEAGAGAGGTRPNCIYAASRTNLELFGLWLVGDETVADDGSDVRQCGIVWDTATYSSILSCVSEDHKRHGIYLLDSSDYNTLAKNTCRGNGDHGIYLSDSDTNIVAGNMSQGNTNSGLYLYPGNDNTINGNMLSGNAWRGLHLRGSDRNTISGNTCTGNTFSGCYMQDSDGNTITGNTFCNNMHTGVEVNGDHNVVSGNTCSGNDANDTGSYDGIQLSSAESNLISENVCKDNDRWGIMVNPNSDFNKISNNYTSGNTSGSIRVDNANCDKNQLEFNTVEEGAPANAGTATRSYGNYDPSADAFVGDVGAAPF